MSSRFFGRLTLIALAIALMALVAAGCGGGGSSSSGETQSTSSGSEPSGGESSEASSGLKEAEKIVSEHEALPSEIGVKEPIKKAVPKGKTVIHVTSPVEADINTGKGIAAAAKVVGWNVETISEPPVPANLQAGVEEAIKRNPDFIVLTGTNAEEISRQLKMAEEANIPVIMAHALQKNGQEGVAADVLPVEVAEEHMEVLAAKAAVDMGGEGTLLAAYLTGFPLPLNYTNAFVSALEKFCPECSVEKMNIQPTSIGKDAPQLICNQLRAHPDTKFLLLSYDAVGVGIEAACKTAGLTEMPKIYTYSPDAPGVEELRNEEKTAGAPQDYGDEGAAIIDAAIRLSNGESVAEDEQAVLDMPIWANEYKNLPEDANELWYLVPNGLEQWETLWGVK